jgi:ABC-2 type transport system permease protein
MKTLIWSVRRELWEHRWVYRVPVLLGGALMAVSAWQTGGKVSGFDAAANPMSAAVARSVSVSLDTAARMILLTSVVVAFVYCAEALHSERHDRSILFWKSLPVGDGTAIAGKAAVPLIIIPALAFAMVLVCQVVARAAFAGTGGRFHSLLASPGAAIVEAAVGALWIAPMYAWILFVSARARRAVLLVALLPPMLVSMVESLATSSNTISQALFHRGIGRYWPRGHLELVGGIDALAIAPATALLRSASLWMGAIVAALLLVGVVRARRRSAESL